MTDTTLYPITVPKWGIEMQEGTVTGWQVAAGDQVNKGDDLIDIETDKIVNTLEAPVAGIVCKQLVGEGDTLKVGELLGVIATGAASAEQIDAFITGFVPADASFGIADDAIAEPTDLPAPTSHHDGDVSVSPVARRLATKLGVDLNQVVGTGRNGRISKADVEAAAQREPSSELPFEAFSSRRQTIAKRLTAAKQAVPHYYLSRTINMDKALAAKQAAGVSINSIILKAVASALVEHPAINSHVADNGVTKLTSIDINLAVDTEQGLTAPLMRDADKLTVEEIQQASSDLAKQARTGRLDAKDVQLGGFTVSNLGALGIDSFTAIINAPQASILAVGAVRPQPRLVGGQWREQHQMTVTLSSDHRAIDGADGARFLATLTTALEQFEA